MAKEILFRLPTFANPKAGPGRLLADYLADAYGIARLHP